MEHKLTILDELEIIQKSTQKLTALMREAGMLPKYDCELCQDTGTYAVSDRYGEDYDWVDCACKHGRQDD
jgi:hypothetical protein